MQFGLLMKRGRAVGCLLLVVASIHSSAQFNALNQIDPVGRNLVSTPTFAICQVYSGEYADASGTVIEDFVSGGGVIDRVSGAFESTIELQFIRAWRISVWRNPDDASRSSNQLDQNVITTQLVISGFNYSLVGSNPPGWRLTWKTSISRFLLAGFGSVWPQLPQQPFTKFMCSPTHLRKIVATANPSIAWESALEGFGERQDSPLTRMPRMP